MLSVTNLTSYMYCPRKLYFNKVLKVYEKIRESPVKGKIKHKIFELSGREDREIIASFTQRDSLEDLEMKFRKTYYKTIMLVLNIYKREMKELEINRLDFYRELWPFFLEEALDKSKSFFELAKEKKVYGEELWMVLPKALPEIRVSSEKLGLRGVVDRVDITEGFVPIEIKTGKAPRDGVWKNNMVQIGAYMMLLSEHYGQEIKEGYVEYVSIKEKRKVVMNDFLKDEILDLIGEVNFLLEQEEIPEKVKEEWKCESCGIKEECFSRSKDL